MTRTLTQRVAIAGALAGILTLTAPAHAAGWNRGGAPELDLFQAAWSWATSLRAPQANAPRPAGRSTRPHQGSIPGVKSDRGTGTDPNGAPGASAATCHPNCVDPKG
jgi:hypothetical protein